MNTIGIIAEYNPFHNGHSYQLKKAKELFHADYVIIAMSGNFVQRGLPAVLDKFSRTEMALKNGADFVFEIPTVFATASAEYFAAAGIGLLDALGCVDAVSFGCETPDLPLMSYVAEILAHEPKDYKTRLHSYLKNGEPFPAAREKAVIGYCRANGLPGFHIQKEAREANLKSLLESPNNILALEYLKAVKRSHFTLKPVPVLREGAGYHDKDLHKKYCSATAIRAHLFNKSTKLSPKAPNGLSRFLPECTAEALLAPGARFLTEQDFSSMLYYKLLMGRESGFGQFADCSAELSNRILNLLPHYRDYQGFCETLKRKEVTYSRISRILLHILLDITGKDIADARSYGFVPYLRLLGFRRDAAGLFGTIQKKAKRPLITKPPKHAALLDAKARAVFEKDVFASDLYYGALAQKTGAGQKPEYRRGMVIL